MSKVEHQDDEYLKLIRDALRVCLNYKPKFGKGKEGGFTLETFQKMYREDEFYAWFGLDSPLVYAAHKAAGGMTSVYRQIGIGCQMVFQHLLRDQLGLSVADSVWSYQVPSTRGKLRTLSLDGWIPLQKVAIEHRKAPTVTWLTDAARSVGLQKSDAKGLRGAVFEVRQGYKSKDSKRQNADVSNAANAYASKHLPVVVLLSEQIDSDVAERYARAQWLLLRGTVGGTSLDSTYVFCREVLGYDLAGFFRRNSAAIKHETLAVFEGLLK
jgi:hypothetical protein